MRPLLRAAARLYPRAWRDRYGDEFNALLDDLTPRWCDILNIICGALVMHLSRLAVLPVACAIGGVAVGAAVSVLTPPVYASSSLVLVHQPRKGAADEGRRVRPIATVIEAVIEKSAVDSTIIAVALRPMPSRGEGEPRAALLDVSGSAGSAAAAKRATEKALGAIMEASAASARRLTRDAGVEFRVLEVPTLPTTRRRESTRNSAIGGMLGLGVGGFVVLVTRRRRRRERA